jgi:hypothetical protein
MQQEAKVTKNTSNLCKLASFGKHLHHQSVRGFTQWVGENEQAQEPQRLFRRFARSRRTDKLLQSGYVSDGAYGSLG